MGWAPPIRARVQGPIGRTITSCSKLQSLPESFGGLSKLKYLDLSYCVRLENLPSFSSLKLQVLCMKSLWNLCDLPDGIDKLTSLTMFEVSTGKNPIIDSFFYPNILECLRLPYGAVKHTIHDVHEVGCGHHLQIHQLETVEHLEDAVGAKLRDNPNLWELSLRWDHVDWTGSKRDAEVLANLIPPRTLKGFELEGYRSTNFPNWMLEISSYLPYLSTIKLINLTCDSLPPLGMLANLRLLEVSCMPNIMKIGKEFYGEEGACKKLRVVQLSSLENLEEWWTTRSREEEDDDFLIPNLHLLSVSKCPKLKFIPYPPKSMYWNLSNSEEVLPMHGFGRLSSSTLPFCAELGSFSFSSDKWGRLQHLATLEELTFYDQSGSLLSLPEATPYFPSLKSLCLWLCGLEMLPEWLGQLITLKELSIWYSPNLTSLPESILNLTALKKLSIVECPRLIKRCYEEDAHKISHIPKVNLEMSVRFPKGLMGDPNMVGR